jgi:Spy/CpxP family protein refolding chaperone
LNQKKNSLRTAVVAVLSYSLAFHAAQSLVRAQDCHSGPPPVGGAGGNHMPPPGGRPAGDADDRHSPPPPGPGDGPQSTMRGGLQLGPPGRWWDDKEFAQALGLSAAQARKMDEIFRANRETLLGLYYSLKQEELTLERLTTGSHLQEEQIFQQIDTVTKARAALEKANAHMLLEIRKQMTEEQTERLDEHRPGPPS